MMTVRKTVVIGLMALLPAMAFGMPEMANMAGNKEPQGATAAEQKPPLAGKVIETMKSGGYSYICLEKEDGALEWVAVPEMYIQVGDQIELEQGVQMGQFVSKPLNRTFERIIFSNGPTEKFNEKRKKSAHGAVNMEEAKGSIVKDKKVVESLKVEKATGPNAYTVEEVYRKKAELADKNILVRGQVVKASGGIMDRNWLHIQDGSGEQAKGTNKLVVTTKDRAGLGEIVTISGPLHIGKDFGGGYYYEVIVEDATLITK